jgi:hypothetical protein
MPIQFLMIVGALIVRRFKAHSVGEAELIAARFARDRCYFNFQLGFVVGGMTHTAASVAERRRGLRVFRDASFSDVTIMARGRRQ